MPGFNKNNRRKSAFEILPKDAYVIKIMNAKEGAWPDGKKRLDIAFDIAEGDYSGFYKKQWESSKASNTGAQWPFDAVYTLNIPDGSDERAQNNWDYFFVDVMDSNGGFEFGGDPKTLKGKIVGGKFANVQRKGKKGGVFDHMVMRWSCSVESVRDGSAAKNLPNDKLVSAAPVPALANAPDGFLDIPDGVEDEELPFD